MRSLAFRLTAALLTFSAGALAASAWRGLSPGLPASLYASFGPLLLYSAGALWCFYLALAGGKSRRNLPFTILMLLSGLVMVCAVLLVASAALSGRVWS